ncbi:tetratricopeptide (TPR) repeat protein [Aquimarina sp. EL_43]|uniref:tetratricopeptide repeat-containing sensor histidine kinase n=1 Tax=unclassified Aquimarina TaxID=2627091 RepID=UPI0018C8D878|nr:MULTISPECIES: histidine kinase [unclassified Aquimarina]MBG6130972.1 tetratricopeptide (TPR) repeat protein [Aquimarina sp. EL_35]MBG6151431.1 tetratricopeptide (TPR) repeat protein [Aquimarina sp. EL_32]MBG6169362.1 tetratricopeptide (TPR) repeat protein [Aquimarina sp. EL_43]
MTTNRYIIVLFFLFELLSVVSIYAKDTTVIDPKKRAQDSILINLKQKREQARQLNHKDSIIKNDLSLLRFYTYNQSKNTDTGKLFDLLEYCTDNDNINCRIEVCAMLAWQMQKKDQYSQALEYYNKAIDLSNATEKEPFKWHILINQGTLFNELLEPELARENFKISFKYIKPNEEHRMAISLLNISSTFEKTNPDSMAYFSNKAIRILEKNPKGDNSLEIAANNVAYGYIKQNKLKEASRVIDKYIDLNNITDSKKEQFGSFFFNTVGELNYKLGHLDKAIDYYKKSISYTENAYPPSNLMSLNDLAEIYEIKGELKKAIQYLKAKENYLQKFNEHNLKKEIARSEYNKILAEKNKLITNLEKKNQKTNKQVYNSKILALSSGVITIICILFFLTIYQKSRLKISQLNEEISLVRLKSLRSIMNPHFLFNSFNTLQSYILQKDKFEASEHMRELSQLIRKILSNSDSLYISFKEELEIIKTYITLENKRFEDQFELNLTIDENLIELNPKIPSMIIQPHLENAVIHGLSSKNKKILKLSFQKKKNSIQCIIEDNGIGRKKSAKLNKKSKNTTNLSIASGNTAERIKLLRKVGYKKTSMKITDLLDDNKKSRGTRVTVNLPIIN